MTTPTSEDGVTSEIGLGFTKLPDETWRQTAERIAQRYGLVVEVLAIFDEQVTNGAKPQYACWSALYDWDLLEPVSSLDKS